MNKNIVKFIAILVMCFMICGVLVACKGETGPKGETGAQGEKGEQGEQGIQGLPGDKGDKGDKGDQGEQGIQGDKGDKGDKGDQGEKGDKGDQGEKGETGAAGADGLTPTIGDNGNWFIGDTDTGVKAEGQDGEDAYVCTNHNFKEIVVEATNGAHYALRACLDCGWAEIACGHKSVTPNVNAPTCTTIGFTEDICDECGVVVGDPYDIVDPELHNVVAFSEQAVADGLWYRANTPNAGVYECPCTAEKIYAPVCQNGCGTDLYSPEFQAQYCYTVAAPGHAYDEVNGWHEAEKKPGESPCLQQDVWVNECLNCYSDYDLNHIDCVKTEVRNDAPGHTWGEWTVATLPTETTEGEYIRICTVCNLEQYGAQIVTDSVVVPALDPTNPAYVYAVVVAPDCENDGSATYTYTHADGTQIVVPVVLEKLGHTYTTQINITKLPSRPTELTGEYTLEEMDAHIAQFNGTVEFTCDDCGKVHTETIPAITPAMYRFLVATGKCDAPADTYEYTVLFNDVVTGELETIVITFQVDGIYIHDEAPAQDDCVIVEGKDKYYWVYKCDKCGNWVVAYYENK